MKTNFYQRFILILYVITLLIIALFFIPYKQYVYRYNYETTFGSIWTANKSVDFFRFLIEILIVTLFFLIGFLLLSKKENPDWTDRNFKKQVKKEIIFFLFFIVIILGTPIYMWGYNYVIELKKRGVESKNEVLRNQNLTIKHTVDSLTNVIDDWTSIVSSPPKWEETTPISKDPFADITYEADKNNKKSSWTPPATDLIISGDKISQLYQVLKSDYDLPNEIKFREKLCDSSNAVVLFNTLRKDEKYKNDIPKDFNTFCERLRLKFYKQEENPYVKADSTLAMNKRKVDSLKNTIKHNEGMIANLTINYYKLFDSDDFKNYTGLIALISFLTIYPLRFLILFFIRVFKFLNS